MTETVTIHRLSQLLGMLVVASGVELGRVVDVRLRAPAGTAGYGGLVVAGFVVSPHNTGSMLGYDRRRRQGPWLIRVLVERLHRDAGYLPWEGTLDIDWEQRTITTPVTTLETVKET